VVVVNEKPFFVVFDYGMGGVWAVIYASDKEQITSE
jgi:tryptophan-rich sensory protein